MHYFYYLLDPIRVLINYLLWLTPRVFLIVIVILSISHWSILGYRGKVLWDMRKKKTIAGRQIWHITTTTLHVHVAKYKTLFSEHERGVFAHKIGYIFRGLFLICFWRTLVSYLFSSFVASGWVNNVDHSYTLMTDVEFVITDDYKGALPSEKSLIQEVFGDKALVAIEPSTIQKIDFAINYLALYELALLVIAGYFFLISLWNSFLKNTGRFFVTVTILLHLTGALLATYVHLWSNTIT
jgi:hypothetical protein